MIQEALSTWIQRKDFLSKRFKRALWQFEGDDLGNVSVLADEFRVADLTVAHLQNLQDTYNGGIKVNVDSEDMTLADAIKQIGGSGRMAKMWREAADSTGTERHYGGEDMTRKMDEISKERTISVKDCMDQAEIYSSLLSKFRIAIREGNQTQVDFPDTPEAWFE